jgi:hypothetical protein
MKRLVALIFLLLVPFGWSGAQTSADLAAEDALLEAARLANEKGDGDALRAVEPRALQGGAAANRQGEQLILHLGSGQDKAYQNAPECRDPEREAACQTFSLIAHTRARGLFVVAKFYYESMEYFLVDETTGEETVLGGVPTFSPSGKRVLVMLENDTNLGFVLQIWQRNDRRFLLDWSGSPYAGGMYTAYKFLGWPSEDRIELRAVMSFEPPKPDTSRHFAVVRNWQGWGVNEIPE